MEVDAVELGRRLLVPDSVWRELQVVGSTGSTNADLAQAARDGAQGGKVLVAGHQSTGRGRFARVWEAPPGKSVAVSVLLRPPASVPLESWLWLPLLAGLAVSDGLARIGIAASLKWPNDVLIGGRKVCGILAERVVAGAESAAVIGMGINTRLSESELPVPTATSLLLVGSQATATEVVAAVLDRLGHWYHRWVVGEDLRDEYARRCTSIGRELRVQLGPGDQIEGVGVAVDQQGRLVVRTAAGEQAFAAGDVVHLR